MGDRVHFEMQRDPETERPQAAAWAPTHDGLVMFVGMINSSDLTETGEAHHK
jgi:hypothetical protein